MDFQLSRQGMIDHPSKERLFLRINLLLRLILMVKRLVTSRFQGSVHP